MVGPSCGSGNPARNGWEVFLAASGPPASGSAHQIDAESRFRRTTIHGFFPTRALPRCFPGLPAGEDGPQTVGRAESSRPDAPRNETGARALEDAPVESVAPGIPLFLTNGPRPVFRTHFPSCLA